MDNGCGIFYTHVCIVRNGRNALANLKTCMVCYHIISLIKAFSWFQHVSCLVLRKLPQCFQVQSNLPFPTYRRFLQQTTFEIIIAKGEIIHNEQFIHLPHRFQLYSIIILSFMEIFNILDLWKRAEYVETVKA